MANIVTQLQNKNGDNLYPLAGGMAADSITTSMIQDGAITTPKLSLSTLIDVFYPVGSYYETSDTSFNPNTAWGGTWVEDDSGRVLVSKKSSGSMATVGATGGSENHRHDFKVGMVRYYGALVGAESTDANTWGAWSYSQNKYAKSSGQDMDSHAHTRNSALQTGTTALTEATQYTIGDTDQASSYQPWLVVKRWHRTS